LLSIHYIDGSHVSFALDHWGASYAESPLVTVDYARVHEIEVRLSTLEWPQPSDEGVFKGEIVIRVDGAVVWKTPQKFYRAAAGSLEIAANRIGGSTCDESFTGGIIDIARPAAHP
jgi:hypothetical protein